MVSQRYDSSKPFVVYFSGQTVNALKRSEPNHLRLVWAFSFLCGLRIGIVRNVGNGEAKASRCSCLHVFLIQACRREVLYVLNCKCLKR
jgi:hypothetical protein